MGGFLSDLFGGKPSVPDLPKLDLGQEQLKAISANKQALPTAQSLASSATQFNEDQITRILSSVIPNFQQITGGISKNIAAEVAGQIPKDVQQQITQNSAARALTGGFSGSGMHGNLLARDLGLTSLQLTQQGLSSAESWLKTAGMLYEPGIVNVQSMFITPQQQAAFDVNERNAQFNQQWMKNQIAAMPDPVTTGLWNTGMSLLDSVLSSYSGSSTTGGQVPRSRPWADEYGQNAEINFG